MSFYENYVYGLAQITEGGLKDLQMDTMITKWEIRTIWEDAPPHPT